MAYARLRCSSNGSSSGGAAAGASRTLGLGTALTGGNDAGRTACSGGGACTGAVRTLGRGTFVTGGSVEGRAGGFGELTGSRSTTLRRVGGATAVLRSSRGGGCCTGNVRAVGLGMMNADLLLPRTSRALR